MCSGFLKVSRSAATATAAEAERSRAGATQRAPPPRRGRRRGRRHRAGAPGSRCPAAPPARSDRCDRAKGAPPVAPARPEAWTTWRPGRISGAPRPESARPGHDHVDDRAPQGGAVAPGPHAEVHGHEDHERQAQHGHALGMAAVDRPPPRPAARRTVYRSRCRPSTSSDGRGEDPAGPARHAGHGPTRVVHHGPRQLEHRPAEGRAQGPHAENPAQGVGPGAGDDELGQHDHGVGEVDGGQVAEQHRAR